MKQIKNKSNKKPVSGLRNSFQNLLSTYGSKYSEVLKTISHQVSPFGSNKGSAKTGSAFKADQNSEVSENRYSVLYKLSTQYHHVGCSSQAEAQSALGILMTDENRVPIGIYDSKTDQFEWEIIGQYFHSQDPISDQQNRLDEVLTISRALRRRDSSWQPGYLQKQSFFA